MNVHNDSECCWLDEKASRKLNEIYVTVTKSNNSHTMLDGVIEKKATHQVSKAMLAGGRVESSTNLQRSDRDARVKSKSRCQKSVAVRSPRFSESAHTWAFFT
jgi:hypothetical protein